MLSKEKFAAAILDAVNDEGSLPPDFTKLLYELKVTSGFVYVSPSGVQAPCVSAVIPSPHVPGVVHTVTIAQHNDCNLYIPHTGLTIDTCYSIRVGMDLPSRDTALGLTTDGQFLMLEQAVMAEPAAYTLASTAVIAVVTVALKRKDQSRRALESLLRGPLYDGGMPN